MTDRRSIGWETCAADACIGVRLASGGRCWAHADTHALDAALNRLGEDGRLDARGVPITAELLARLLTAAPHNDEGAVVLADTQFTEATFHHDADFSQITFHGTADFDRTTFMGAASFSGAAFQRRVTFANATFHDATFDEARFHGEARFREATFRGVATFGGATFDGLAGFHDATFRGPAGLGGVIFRRGAWFVRTIFQQQADFTGATFEQARAFGPMLVRKYLSLDGAAFHERVLIQVSAAAVCCRHTRFLAGAQLLLRWAQVMLDDADLAAPSILTGTPTFPGLQEGRWAQAMERLLPNRRGRRGRWRWQPRLLSLRRADVAGLTVGLVDLRPCQFADAHNLDRLRLESLGAFGDTPAGWRWAARQAIAEEHQWRRRHHQRAASRHAPESPTDAAPRPDPPGGPRHTWFPPTCQPPAWVSAQPLAPVQIAALYRALRKGREDLKDEPGAADFYYGEMEMRRFARREDALAERRRRRYGPWAAASTERAVLWLYWLTSGYGLRASRALTALAAVVVVTGGAFALWGFDPPASLGQLPDAIRFSAQAATTLTHDPDRPLTPLGEWLHLGVRLMGPVLLGLAVLSIRGRVKR